MHVENRLSQEDFDSLLGWFSPDADEAGRKYEQIRVGLNKFFAFRGCPEPETLTDVTIDRVAGKLASGKFDDKFNVYRYFYSFASRIFHEDHYERQRLRTKHEEIRAAHKLLTPIEDAPGRKVPCLEKCLNEYPREDKDLLLRYYSFEPSEKSSGRIELADRRKLDIDLLRTRISRLKKAVRACLRQCLRENNA